MAESVEARSPADAAERACQKLCRRLSRLVTDAGYQALLARALHLARADYPFLDGVRASSTAGPCLDGLNDRLQGVDDSTASEALAAVLSGVIGLRATFIGENLALNLIRDVWPDSPLDGMDSAAPEAQA
jgi:hypothetical protein